MRCRGREDAHERLARSYENESIGMDYGILLRADERGMMTIVEVKFYSGDVESILILENSLGDYTVKCVKRTPQPQGLTRIDEYSDLELEHLALISGVNEGCTSPENCSSSRAKLREEQGPS